MANYADPDAGEPSEAQLEAAIQAFNDHGGIRQSIDVTIRAALCAAARVSREASDEERNGSVLSAYLNSFPQGAKPTVAPVSDPQRKVGE